MTILVFPSNIEYGTLFTFHFVYINHSETNVNVKNNKVSKNENVFVERATTASGRPGIYFIIRTFN